MNFGCTLAYSFFFLFQRLHHIPCFLWNEQDTTDSPNPNQHHIAPLEGDWETDRNNTVHCQRKYRQIHNRKGSESDWVNSVSPVLSLVHTHIYTLDLFVKQWILNIEFCIVEKQLNRTAWSCQSLQLSTKASTIKTNTVNVQKNQKHFIKANNVKYK